MTPRAAEAVMAIQYRDGELEEDGKRAVVDVPTDLQIKIGRAHV